MIELSPRTEALARLIAAQQKLSIDETIWRALEARQLVAVPAPLGRKLPPEIAAIRAAAIERAVLEIAALPELDPRSSREIMDDLDPL